MAAWNIKEVEDMNATQWKPVIFLSALAVVLSSCVALDRPTIIEPLNANEADAVLACQETIKKSGKKFVQKKLARLEACADKVLKLKVELENELITEEQYDKRLANRVEPSCLKKFSEIKELSTRLVDDIVDKCEPVQDIILTDSDRGDPLGFQAFGDVYCADAGEFETVEELAGFICASKEIFVDLMLSIQVPRFPELLNELEALGGDGVEALLEDFLDERCLSTEVEDDIASCFYPG